ncbi:MAG TPA: YciI family protein [Candidatus Eisenbacteria bacterium]|nr:YciI family protein [Candidatus Eisenbacteria bacterium]
MKFLCIVYNNEKTLKEMPRAEYQELDDISLEYDETLRNGGHYLYSNALDYSEKAATVRLKQGKAMVTDGPFAETREQVGGFILIEAKDMQQAITLATNIPAIRLGGVEIRPIKELTHSRDQA